MADPQFITQLDAITTMDDTDLVVIEKNPGGTPETNKMIVSDFVAEVMRRTRWQISRTVSANNLIVAIKNPDGSDASSARPISFLIDGIVRKLSSALSLQINAGTNSFNLGAVEFAGLVQELFVYVGWRASNSSIFLLLSRQPDLREYAEASSTATSERYGANSGAAPAGSDRLQNIGRVNVQNSGTASFNWSVPAANKIHNFPIYETSWLDWAPVQTGFSANPTSTVNRYRIRSSAIDLFVRQNANGTSNATTFTLSLPFTARTITNMVWSSTCTFADNGTVGVNPGMIRILSAATVMDVFTNMALAAWTNVNGKRLANMGVLTYEIGTI